CARESSGYAYAMDYW
nr:immunoglobulin heavy chain junction region [Mus musculus]NSM06203.1 immunoglobulin heavy chain junction region [Mus musculus]